MPVVRNNAALGSVCTGMTRSHDRTIREVSIMMTRRFLLAGSAVGLATAAGLTWGAAPDAAETFEVSLADDEWRKRLTSDQYAVLRDSATERPFTSPLLNEKRRGNFACAGCDLDLFSSTT